MAKTQHGRDLTGEEMAEMLEEFSNGASRKDVDDFANKVVRGVHRTIQQKIMGAFVACIEKWAATEDFDLRNKATVELAKKFVAGSGDKYDRQLPYV